MIMPHHSQAGTEVFIYMPHRDERFTIATSVLSNAHMNIQEALISTCNNQFDLDTYIILDEQNQVIIDEQQFKELKISLYQHLKKPNHLPHIKQKRLPRSLAHFNVKTQINFNENPINGHTELFLITSDRPGLLATLSRVFLNLSIHLHNAKIATAGERVEDMFYITNKANLPLSHEEMEELKEHLVKIGST